MRRDFRKVTKANIDNEMVDSDDELWSGDYNIKWRIKRDMSELDIQLLDSIQKHTGKLNELIQVMYIVLII